MPDILTRTEGLLTPQKLKERFLVGINLKDKEGNPFPDEFYQYTINSATSIIEHELDILITPTSKIDDIDYRAPNYMAWNFVQLDHYPIISVEKWEIIFPSNVTLVEFPLTWIRIDGDKGLLRMFPDQGSIPSWMIGNGTYLPQIMLGKVDLPHFYKIEYTAGFPENAIPMAINEAIGLTAAMLPLTAAGDLILGHPGISNYSIGLDGISQSMSSTSSPGTTGYAGRLAKYEARLEALMTSLKNYYKGPIFDVV